LIHLPLVTIGFVGGEPSLVVKVLIKRKREKR
jgi:hypothetical protein